MLGTPLIAAAEACAVILLALVLAVGSVGVACGQPPGGWPTFRDGVVELSHPPGWTVTRDASTGRLIVQGGPTVGLVIWPFFVNGQLETATANEVLVRMARSQAPRATWGPVRAVGRGAMRADGRAGAAAMAASLVWTPSARGTAVQFLLARAPRATGAARSRSPSRRSWRVSV